PSVVCMPALLTGAPRAKSTPPEPSLFHPAAPPAIYALSLHDALPISQSGTSRPHLVVAARLEPLKGIDLAIRALALLPRGLRIPDRKSTRLNSSHVSISYAVFCLKKTSASQQHLGSLNYARSDHLRIA